MTTIFLVLIGALFAYEGFALANKRQGDTISELMWAGSKRPLLPFLFGLLCGHLFWQR